MVEDSVFPEDTGTGAPYGDFDDAANWASVVHRPNAVNFVVAGLDLNPNYTDMKVYTGSGRAIIEDDTAYATKSEETREFGVAYSAILEARTSTYETNNDVLELNTGINYVHVGIDLAEGDSPYIYVDQDDSGPADPSFKIGTVDTDTETVEELGRDPTATFEEIDSAQSVTISDDETVTYGRDHVHPDRGIEPNSVAIGVGARAPDSTGDPDWFNDTANSVAIGYRALVNNTGARSNGVGYRALANNTGFGSNAVGYRALANNTGGRSNGVGREALENNTASNSNGVGYRALRDNTGGSSNGVGYQALENNTGDNSNGVGYLALGDNTGANSNGVGHQALANNTGDRSNGVGYRALEGDGLSNPSDMGSNVNAFGYEAGRNNTGEGVILIGQQAGINNSEDDVLLITDRNGETRLKMDLTNGNMEIGGSLSENATLN